jgi:hypothetical protein
MSRVTSSRMNFLMYSWSLGSMLMNLSPMPLSLRGTTPEAWLFRTEPSAEIVRS